MGDKGFPSSSEMSRSGYGIHVKDLTRNFGTLTAIHKINFTVHPGEIIGFLGPNGAGKSTTMRILSGTLPASSGFAWVGGICVARHPHQVKRKIGYMPENNPLPGDMRVGEYLRFRARLKDIPSRQLRTSVREVMDVCDLARTARRKVIATLSKGFRQRVGIADALLGKPEIILMDEPTIGLDPHQIQGIRKLIDNLRGQHTVILSSHILPEIERSCDRVIIINHGRVVAAGSGSELREEFLPGNRFSLVVEGKEDTVSVALASCGLGAEVLESNPINDRFIKLTVRLEDPAATGSQLIEAFRNKESLTLHSLTTCQPTLEDIFLTATKRSWEETIRSKHKVSLSN